MKLSKKLKLIDVISIASGAMISSGLFILPGVAHARAGPAVVVSYFLSGLLAMTGMLSIAELVTAMPKAGGDYFFISRSMGPGVGSISGLLSWFALSLKSAFALVGMAAFAAILMQVNIKVVAVILLLFFIAINMVGVKEASKFQVMLVTGLVLLLVFYIFKGLPVVKFSNFEPFAPNGLSAIIGTAGFVFVSYGGLLKVASVAEEVQNPGKIIPLGLILSLLIVTILYSLVVLVTTGVLGASKLDNSLTPITEGAGAAMGKTGSIVMSIAAILAFISTANAGIMSASRYPLALSRDGIFPPVIAKVSRKTHVPYVAVIITGIFMCFALLLNLKVLIEAASTVLILTYILSCISVIVLRESRVQNYRPVFKSPLYPYIQVIGILGFGFILVDMGRDSLIITVVLIVISLLVYFIYGKRHSKQEFALLHLVERITAKEFASGELENELKDIIFERDNIVKDRFDELLEDAIYFDFAQNVTFTDFLNVVSRELSGSTGLSAEFIRKLILKREEQGSTVIRKGIAIPHIILPDTEHIFKMAIARSITGITFPEIEEPVHAVFVLAGSLNERNFHLIVLSAIAQIIQSEKFEENWYNAKDVERIKDLLLLGKRRRLI